MTARPDFEVAVVGLGLIGSAALRYLAEAGIPVIGLGPSEPADRTRHFGVFASHYDSGRITRILDDRIEWAELARRSIASYSDLAARTGIEFHRPTGVIHVAPDDRLDAPAAVGGALGVDFDRTPIEEGATLPYRFPNGLTALTEHSPAGHIDPRAMLRAQLSTARQSGAEIRRRQVTNIAEKPTRVELRLADGDTVTAGRMLVAAGAYTGALLPNLAFRVKTETTILARLDPAVGREHQNAPAVLYDLEHPGAGEVYLVPPVEYPDGNWYLKMGCNLSVDRSLEGPDAMQAWMAGDAIEDHRPLMIEVLRSFLPGLPIDAFVMKPCLVTYTDHGLPYLDRLSARSFVAAGGNGSAAKSANAIGKLAAGLVTSGRWTDSLPSRSFGAVGREDSR